MRISIQIFIHEINHCGCLLAYCWLTCYFTYSRIFRCFLNCSTWHTNGLLCISFDLNCGFDSNHSKYYVLHCYAVHSIHIAVWAQHYNLNKLRHESSGLYWAAKWMEARVKTIPHAVLYTITCVHCSSKVLFGLCIQWKSIRTRHTQPYANSISSFTCPKQGLSQYSESKRQFLFRRFLAS